MPIRRMILATSMLYAAQVMAQQAAPAPASPDTEVSYALGLLHGERLRHDGVTTELSVDAMARGMRDGLGGKSATAEQKQQVGSFYRGLGAAQLDRNHAAARDFLAHNSKIKGVSTTPSGLQYTVDRAGDLKAANPQPADRVIVQYRGSLLDGTEFDSSYARGQPSSFQVAGVIKGLQEGLALMKPGAQWRFFIPPDLGYGDQATGNIPAGSLLIFDVQIESVAPGPAH